MKINKNGVRLLINKTMRAVSAGRKLRSPDTKRHACREVPGLRDRDFSVPLIECPN